MKTPSIVLALAGASLLLIAGAFWLLRGERTWASDPERAVVAAEQEPGEASAEPRGVVEPGGSGERYVLALQAPRTREADEEAEPGEPFAWRMRDPPRVDGPLIESHYAAGQPEFLGRQVRDADGRWVRDGPWTAWYENGQVCERGAYRAGVEDGPWQWWYESGGRMAAGSWVEGRRVGEWTYWHENGALGMVGSYDDGVGSGLWTLYHESGWKRAEGPWVDGAPGGHWNVWTEDGSLDLERTGTYVDGVKVD